MPRARRPALGPLLRFWQRQLRLQDWHLTAHYDTELPDGAVGHCSFSLLTKTATIRLAAHPPATSPVEQVLIHELLHLHIGAHTEPEGLAQVLLEQSVDALAWAFYTLRHKG